MFDTQIPRPKRGSQESSKFNIEINKEIVIKSFHELQCYHLLVDYARFMFGYLIQVTMWPVGILFSYSKLITCQYIYTTNCFIVRFITKKYENFIKFVL